MCATLCQTFLVHCAAAQAQAGSGSGCDVHERSFAVYVCV